MPGNLEPIGFWSYTSSDDTASRGHLSLLRRLLADDLQRLIGRDPTVRIFQDVAAIPKGSDWKEKIHEALDAASLSFMIPILTPAFLQSEWCCAEVLHFRAREQTLGRNNLIFPFHLTDTNHVDPENPREVFDRRVLALLRSRQHLDFRALELEEVNHRDVRFKLRELSTCIRDALRAATRPEANRAISAEPPRSSGTGPSVADGPAALQRTSADTHPRPRRRSFRCPRRRRASPPGPPIPARTALAPGPTSLSPPTAGRRSRSACV